MLELSDYDENEEASTHKRNSSGNVECVEVNNGIKMANKRSKSLEKEDIVVSGDDDVIKHRSSSIEPLKRPDTAPPLLPDFNKSKSILTSSVAVADTVHMECNESNKTNVNYNNNNINNYKTEIIDNQQQQATSWHEHIYKPPKAPTPYSITDILQWGSTRKISSSPIQMNSDSNNNSSRSYKNVEPSTLQHLLNLNINSPRSPRSVSGSLHNNTNNSNGINSRGLSFSETSEDESIASDQPLNLCVIKSRDSSPGIIADRSLSGKSKKGKSAHTPCLLNE